jgi:predicted Zn-dependent protease with MMP-like domain
MDRAEFEEHVERALESLTPELRRAMSNVEIVVEDENPEDPDLFGLYLGIPLTERGEGYAGALPDKIAVYRLPLEVEFGGDPPVLEEEIRITVLHELAHHFGIDEDRLAELGWS